MTEELVKRLRMDWDTDQSILSQAVRWDNDRRKAADRIEALTAERDARIEALTAQLTTARADYQIESDLREVEEALLKAAEAERDRLHKLLAEAASDLTASVDAEYPPDTCAQYPDIAKRHHRDMELVRRIEAELKGETP